MSAYQNLTPGKYPKEYTQHILSFVYLRPFIPPPYSPDLSPPDYFLFPKLKMKLKGCCWDPRSRNWWIKEGPKRGIFGSFSETVEHPKACIYTNGAYFQFKKKVYLSHVSSILKKKNPETFGLLCIYTDVVRELYLPVHTFSCWLPNFYWPTSQYRKASVKSTGPS
jgi:hypothetical protein